MVILSRNNFQPYQPLDKHTPMYNEAFINQITGFDTYEVVGQFYLIIEDENLRNVRLVVDHEYNSGFSLWISEVDLTGDPIEWRKYISLGDLNISGTSFVKMFKYKWSIINNIYFIHMRENASFLNVYCDAP